MAANGRALSRDDLPAARWGSARRAGKRRVAALESGAWEERYGHLRQESELDAGPRLIVSELDRT